MQVEYPEIYGKISQTVDFNRSARQRIDKDVLEFQQEMAARTEEEMRNPRSNQDALDISFDVKYADENMVSIQIFKSKFINGIPHPLNEVSTFNYDLKSNRRLELKDLFLPGTKYLETISTYCLKVLQSRPPVEGEKLADGDWINGATAKAENYATWNLIKKGLLITFNDNQIAPPPVTRQSVLIPYDKLKDIADPDGALAKITK